MGSRRGRIGGTLVKKLWIAGGIAILIVAAVGVTLLRRDRPEPTAALRGREVAQRLGCFGCHGPDGIRGIADPLAPDRKVPDWTEASAELYIKSADDIRHWILHGAPIDQPPVDEDMAPKRLVPMPAYEGRLSGRELDDLVAYFESVSGWQEDMPDAAFEGRKIAIRMGCFGCHGPSGIGGVPNPGSLKGTIPAWGSEDFDELVQNDDELREWILDGRSKRLWRSPAARFYLERQETPMPAYRDHLSDDELDNLVAYIHWLRSP
jgi:mono/diheme cytochrome c family protein